MSFSHGNFKPWDFGGFGPEFEAPNTGAIPSSSCTSQGKKTQPPKKAQKLKPGRCGETTWKYNMSILSSTTIYIYDYMIIYV